MKNFYLTIFCLILFQIVHAQQSRLIIKFNHGWEMFRIDSSQQMKSIAHVRESTSFKSQFNQETVDAKTLPSDSIRSHEVRNAVKGFALEYPVIRSLNWEKVSLPHPARYENDLNPGVNQFTGICYYRKYFDLPASYKNRHSFIRFEGAMQTASVWINGKFITQHQGGYLPFNVVLDGEIKQGQNEIIVRLDNNDNINVPPGKPLARLGFLYWSGIYRDTWLIVTDKLHITDPADANTIAGGGVFARSENISDSRADVVIKTQLRNLSAVQSDQVIVKQVLTNIKSRSVKLISSKLIQLEGNSTKDITQVIKVTDPALWSADEPNLYLLNTQVWSGGKKIDDIKQKIGIRKLSYTRAGGFKLNDKPLRIVGTNRHQDFPFVGNAMSDAMQCRDMKRLKEAGFNFVRLSHYPQDPSVYKYCDSIGLMLGDPIPGWQFFNNNEIFKERVFSDIRQMIRRDRNHPSIIMWEVSLNETYPADSFRIASSKIAHEEYPGDNFFTCGDTYGAKQTAWDVPFNSWQDPFGRPQDVQPGQPGFIREYGDYEFGGASSTTRVNRADGEKGLLQNAWNFQWEHNLLMGPNYYPWTIGDATWCAYDGFEAFNKGTSDWGAIDIFRLPKFSYYFFRSQLSPDKPVFAASNKPMVYIANWWTPTDSLKKVIVYSNCDETALYVNGKLIKKQRPDTGPDSDYGDYEKGGIPFDGGNANHLPHAPFTFTHIKWQAGTLKVLGYINGKLVAQQTVRSPGGKSRIRLIADNAGIPLIADGADAIFVHARIIDKNGTVNCLDNDSYVSFNIKGRGKIIGPSRIRVRGGIASVLVQANNDKGPIFINCKSAMVPDQKLIIRSISK